MAITIDWVDNKHTILKWTYQGKWTWEEVAAAIRKQNDLLSTVSSNVTVIADMREGDLIPKNLFTNMKSLSDSAVGKTGLTIIISNSSYLKTMHNCSAAGILDNPIVEYHNQRETRNHEQTTHFQA
jgi:hypothetical protein